MKQNCIFCRIAGLLVVIGALNWGAIGIFQVNVVANLLGDMTTATRFVYGLVGVAGVLKLLSCFKICPCQK